MTSVTNGVFRGPSLTDGATKQWGQTGLKSQAECDGQG
jgi:hypothetical protein